jgi:hypothetical protein
MKPSKLKILGIDYQVDFEDSELTGWSGAGQVNETKCLIKICTNANSESHQKSVLLHEIIESINYRMELKIGHNVITSLECGLIQVILDNPELLEYFND